MGPWWEVVQFAADKLVSWPVVVFVGVLAFRKPLAALLSRESVKVGVGKELFTLTAERAVELQKEKTVVAKGLAVSESERLLEAARNVDVSPIVKEQIGLIRADLEKLHVEPQEKVDLLVKHLAVTQLYLRAEGIYRTIFGSQIVLLKQLNTTNSASTAELLPHYEQAKATFPAQYQNYSFDPYLKYLIGRGLIIAQADQRYAITVAGKEFLKWITEMGLAEDKAL
jgi:hypothetical protein